MDLLNQNIDQKIVDDLMQRFVISGLPVLGNAKKTSNVLKGTISGIIGRPFFLVSYHGSHDHKIAGTIIGFDVSDEGWYLELYVSVPTFWGSPLHCLGFNSNDNTWYVIVEDLTCAIIYKDFPITLYLL